MCVTVIETVVRTYIFTAKEKEQLLTYLETGIKEEGYRVLQFRIKKSYRSMRAEFELMTKVYETLS